MSFLHVSVSSNLIKKLFGTISSVSLMMGSSHLDIRLFFFLILQFARKDLDIIPVSGFILLAETVTAMILVFFCYFCLFVCFFLGGGGGNIVLLCFVLFFRRGFCYLQRLILPFGRD